VEGSNSYAFQHTLVFKTSRPPWTAPAGLLSYLVDILTG